MLPKVADAQTETALCYYGRCLSCAFHYCEVELTTSDQPPLLSRGGRFFVVWN